MSIKKIIFLVVVAITIAVAAINLNDITKYILKTAQQIQTSIIGSDNNPNTNGSEGRVDVEDAENSSMTRAPSVQK